MNWDLDLPALLLPALLIWRGNARALPLFLLVALGWEAWRAAEVDAALAAAEGTDGSSLAASLAFLSVAVTNVLGWCGARDGIGGRPGDRGAILMGFVALWFGLRGGQAAGFGTLVVCLVSLGLLEWSCLRRGAAGSVARHRSLHLAVFAASMVAVGVGAWLRVRAGAPGAVGWIGEPFQGDTPSTLLFLGLALPLVLPGRLGGAGGALAHGARDVIDLGSMVGPIRPLLHFWVLHRAFGGSESLAWAGFGMLALATLSAGRAVVLAEPATQTGRPLSALIQGAMGLGLILGSVASEAGQNALGALTVGMGSATAALSLIHGFLVSERRTYPSAGPRGLLRTFPVLATLSAVVVASFAGVPWTLQQVARGYGWGALAESGEGPMVLSAWVLSGPFAALVALRLLSDWWLSSPPSTSDLAPARREPFMLKLAVLQAAGAALALGLVPGALAAVLPHGALGGTSFPSGTVQWQFLLGAAASAVLFGAVAPQRGASPRITSSS